MLLLFLSPFIHFNLFNCVEFEEAKSNGLIKNKHETLTHNFIDLSNADIMWNSTPRVVQTNWITPQYSFLPTPIDHETYIQSLIGPTPKRLYFTDRFPRGNRRNLKVTQRKISRIQLKNYISRDQPRQQLLLGITVHEISKRKNPGSKLKASSYDSVRRSKEPGLLRVKRSQTLSTGTKKKLFPNLLLGDGMVTKSDATNFDDDVAFEKTIPQMDSGEGIMRMREIRKTTKTESSTTTVKQLLIQKADTHSYFEMIETLQEGYMMVFLIELTRLIATKERVAVRDVVQHTDKIIYGLYQSGKLLLFGEPLINVTRKVARILTESEIDVIKNYAAYLHHMLIQRHQALSVEVNTILEYADMLYDDDEGRLLFDALKQFAAYPNIRITGHWLCSSLVHNFLRPYRRLKDTQQRQELMDSVNLKLESYNNTPLQSGNVRQADDPPDENPPSPQRETMTQTEPYSETTRSPRERKRKLARRSRKRKRERKQHRILRYRPEYSQRYYRERILGSMIQRTSVQSRTRVKKKT